MSGEATLEEQELTRPVGSSACLSCDDWGCRRCRPQPEAGEQGLTVEELELVGLRRRVHALTDGLEGLVREIKGHPSPDNFREWVDFMVALQRAEQLLKEDGRG